MFTSNIEVGGDRGASSSANLKGQRQGNLCVKNMQYLFRPQYSSGGVLLGVPMLVGGGVGAASAASLRHFGAAYFRVGESGHTRCVFLGLLKIIT